MYRTLGEWGRRKKRIKEENHNTTIQENKPHQTLMRVERNKKEW